MKISIITVSYNSAKFIESCISSILNQSYKNIEYIIIDGKSTDNTMNIVKKYSKNISRIISEPDKGVYDAMNKGIKFAKGDIVGFLNSDDFYASNEVLSRVASVFKHDPSLELCYSDLTYNDQVDSSRVIRYWKSSNFILGTFSKGWCPPHPTFFVRRSMYERYGNFDLSYSIASDIELMMRFLEVHKRNARYIPELWVKMRMGGLSNKNIKNIVDQNLEVLRALRSHNLSANPISFFANKIFLRSKQFFQRPIN
jgi:glycosyltransferase involved in cell wall biosynthesis